MQIDVLLELAKTLTRAATTPLVWPRVLCLCLSMGFSVNLPAQERLQDLRLNQLQVKGTHNSYRQRGSVVWDASQRYTHLSIPEQLEQRGIRAFELDVHLPIVGKDLLVYHLAVFDAKTSCTKFKDCLWQLKSWSDQHPEHVTIFVWVEVKDFAGGREIRDFAQIDREIFAVLGDRLITPDSVQQDSSTLQAAIQTNGWPTVEESKGKFLFMLDHDARNATLYLRDDSLRGRVMFVRANAANINSPWAALTKTAPGPFHQEALRRNFLISDNVCAANNTATECESELQHAVNAGTHILMDDYEGDEPEYSLGSYYVRLREDLPATCNPVTAPLNCESASIEQERGQNRSP